MTPDERRQALLAKIAGELEIAIADQCLKRAALTKTKQTVRNVLKGRNHTIKTLIEVADGANLDVEITFHKRSA